MTTDGGAADPAVAAVRVALAAAGVDVDRYAADLPLVALIVDRSRDGFAALGRFPLDDVAPEIPLDPSRPPPPRQDP